MFLDFLLSFLLSGRVGPITCNYSISTLGIHTLLMLWSALQLFLPVLSNLINTLLPNSGSGLTFVTMVYFSDVFFQFTMKTLSPGEIGAVGFDGFSVLCSVFTGFRSRHCSLLVRLWRWSISVLSCSDLLWISVLIALRFVFTSSNSWISLFLSWFFNFDFVKWVKPFLR